MPEQERFTPKAMGNEPTKGGSMYDTSKSKEDLGHLSGRVPMPIGKYKGKFIKDVVDIDLPEFMKMLGNLNKIAAMETPPSNYPTIQPAHEKMKEFAQENDLENKLKTWQPEKKAPKTEIEQQVGDEAFIVPDGFAVDMIGPAERGDIRKIGTNRMNVLLSKLKPSDVERYPDFINLIKTYVSQTGNEDKGLESGDANVVPTNIFMGDASRFVRDFGGQPLNNLEDNQKANIHRYFTYSLYKEQPNKFQAHKAFYDNLTKQLLNKDIIREMDGQYLYPNDIIFYEKYKNSQPVGSIGDEAFPINVEVIQKANSRYPKRDNAGTPYYQWLFKELNTNNVLEYRDYSPPSAKSKDHEGLIFDNEMMNLRQADAAQIEGDIKYHNKYKGVMRTRIDSPTFVDKIKGGVKPDKNKVDPAIAARKQDDTIKRDKEMGQMIPKDVEKGIRKDVQRDFRDKEQTDKLGNLVNKYKGESVKKESPSLNEHVQRMLNVANYKVVK